MDVPRAQKPKHRSLLVGGILGSVLVVSLGISQLRPAAPTIEASTLWIDTVRRGEMVRDVRGNGTLEPEFQRLVSAMTSGRVERVLVRPGATVEASTVLLEISNPDVQLRSLDAERGVKLAEAELASLEARLEGDRLAAGATLATTRREARDAERAVKVAERLAAEGLGSSMEIERARDLAEDTQSRLASDQRRLEVMTEALHAQLALRRAEVDRLRAIAQFERERVGSMTVRAGADGVLQELSLDPGAWVNPGQLLARVAAPEKLKAVIQIPEVQARDLAIGLGAQVDTRNGVVQGHVARIDPGVQAGTVTVDIVLDGALPRGARPDLAVEAMIELERLPNVLHVGRPADGASETTVRLFRLDHSGQRGERVAVRLGRSSATRIEVLEGLNEGDRVILSEMSRWGNADRVKLK